MEDQNKKTKNEDTDKASHERKGNEDENMDNTDMNYRDDEVEER